MMRKILPAIILCIACLSSSAQVRDSRINLALLHYDLTQEKLDFLQYELYLSAMIAIGDKSIVLEEVFKSILHQPDYSLEDSLIGLWMEDFTEKDKKMVSKLPQVTNDWRETIFHFVRIAYMCEAYMENTTLSNAYLTIMQDETKFPNIPPEASKYGSKIIQLFEKYHSYMVWYREHPKEFNYFLDLVKKHAKEHYGSDDNGTVVKFMNFIKRNAYDTQSVDSENIPISIAGAMRHFNGLKNKSIVHSELCNDSQIGEFVDEAYLLVYGEDIPGQTKEDLVSFIQTNQLYDPELIYLALILSYYE